MDLALEEAKKAGQIGEVPIGAIIIDENGVIMATAGNRTIEQIDPTAHAEILALRQATHSAKNYRLLNTSLYVTIEPCAMCMGAILHARVKQVVYGAADPKWGAAGSLYDFSQDVRFNHRVEVIRGICEERCRELMQTFFRAKRA
jgi:tRNA(adenine34) deaminase